MKLNSLAVLTGRLVILHWIAHFFPMFDTPELNSVTVFGILSKLKYLAETSPAASVEDG